MSAGEPFAETTIHPSRRSRPRRRFVAALASALLVVASSAVLQIQPASGAANGVGCGYGSGGAFAATLCWLDLSGYDEATSRTPAGQPMTVTLPGGYTVSFTVKTTTPATKTARAVSPVAFPTIAGVPIGATSYTGTPGKPALYQSAGSLALPTDTDNGATTLSLTDIAVKDAANNAVTGYGFAVADVEATGNSERLTWTSDKPLRLLAVAGTTTGNHGCQPNLTGLGTTTVSCQTPAPGAGTGTGLSDVILAANTPTTMSIQLLDNLNGNREAVAFAVLTSQVTLNKTVSGRANPSDSFDTAITAPGGATMGSATTGTGNTSSTGAVTVLSGAGTSFTLSESATAATSTNLALYTETWTCTNAATGSTTVLPTGTGTSKTITPQPGDDITCTMTNAAPPAWTCSSFGYLFQSPNGSATPHDVIRVDLVTGATSTIATTPSNVNAVGYNTLDNYVYGWDITAGTLVRVGAGGTLVSLGVPAGLPVGSFNVGDFDDAGHLWLLNQGAAGAKPWAEIDLAPGSATYGQVLAQGTVAVPATVTSFPADWAFINGAFYGMGQASSGAAHLVRFTASTQAVTDLGAVTGVPGQNFYGAAYADAAGRLYASNNTTGVIYRIDPAAKTAIQLAGGPVSGGNDGARCASAPIPTITVTKSVAGRVASADQFTVNLKNSGGTTLTSATTTGTAASASTVDWPVSQGATYTITDAMAAGSQNPLGGYTQAITCTDTTTGQAVTTGGTAPNWTLTVTTTDNYACTVTNTPVASGPTWTCSAFGYLFQSPDAATHRINQVDLVTGAAPVVGNTPDNVNAVGYNTLDNYVYGWDFTTNQLVRVASDGSLTQLGTPAGSNPGGYILGDVDSAGHLWVGTNTQPSPWAEIDLAPGSPTYGTVIASGSAALPASLMTPGADWSWVNGSLYGVGYSNGFAQAYLTRFSPTAHTWSIVGTVPIPATIGVGATFTDGKYLYASENGSGFIYRIDPVTLQTIKIANGPTSGGNDGTRCASAPIPTITVVKNVGGRVQAGDQFTVSIQDSGAATLTSATTATTQTSVSTTNWPVSEGATYTITDAMAAGSPDALTAYTATIVCTDKNGTTVSTGGGVGAWTLTVAAATDYTCVITNTPGQKSFTVTKTTSTVGPVHPGDTITYTVVVQNTGPVPYTADQPATVSDNLADVLDDATFNNDATNGATVSGNVLSWSGALAPQGSAGDSVTITYSVTVNNPSAGNDVLKNAVVGGTNCPVGSLAAGCGTTNPVQSYRIVKTSTATAVTPGDVVPYTITVTNTGAVDYPAGDPASFTDDLSGVLDDATYNNDADNGATYAAPVLSWSGALAVGQTVTIHYTVTVNNPDTGDQSLKNAVATPPGGPCPAGTTNPDCSTQVPAKQFSVVKSASATAANPGDVVTYTVTVTNTGQVDYTGADPASFTDSLAGVLDDATYGNDATNGATFISPTLSWSGALAVGQTVTITYSVTVNNPDAGDRLLRNVVATPTGGSCATGSTNPGCASQVPVRGFTVSKAASTAQANPGDTITYTVTLRNTGQVAFTAADPAGFTDDLSAVLDDATFNDDASAAGSATAPTYAAPTLSWSGALGIGATVTVTYTVTVQTPDAGDHKLSNTATPSGSGGCADGSLPPCAPTVALVAGYTVAKSASTTVASPGSTITYTVTVVNTGQVDYTGDAPATFSDDLSGVLDDATYDDDASAGATFSAPTLSWSGALAVGQTVTVTYSVTVNNPDGGNHLLENTVTGGTNCPSGSVAPACATSTPVADYSVTKAVSATSAKPGDTITYTVTVANTGQAPFNPGAATFSDDLSGVLDDATYNNDATNGATFSAPTLSWSGTLAIGQTVTITYSVTVNRPDDGDHVLTNAVTGGTNCAAGSAGAGCATSTPVADYTVAKVALAPPVKPGATVTYTVTVTNTGQVPYTAANPASFTDDLSAVLDDATYNDDASNGATFTSPELSWSGALAVGQSVTVTYSVTVNTPDTGDHHLRNTVVGGTNCPVESSDPACVTSQPVSDYTAVKAASATTAHPGDTVTYTVTVTNTGAVDLTAGDPASFTDNLAAVLDDATYNGDVTNGAAYTAPVLTWSGALLIGESVTVTYSVTVNDPGTGDHQLRNAVLGGSCTSPSAPGCSSEVDVQSYATVKAVDATRVEPGKKVTYTITVTNTGAVPYSAAGPASFTDDLSDVLDDATYNDDATNGATYAAPVLSWSGPLDVGQTVAVTYSVTVNDPDAGDAKLNNTVVTGGPGGNCSAPMTAALSASPAAALGAANPQCTAKVPGNQLTVAKASSATTALPGQSVSYTVTLTNTGQTDFTAAQPASFTDDLSGVLDDATYNDDASNGATVSGTTLSWSGPLAMGETVAVTYSVTVNDPDAGDKRLANVVNLPPGLNSNCTAGSTDPNCSTTTAVESYEVVKKASSAEVGPGDTVTYTITVTNTGQVAFTDARPASFTDDLSGVLDDATYNDDATGGAAFSGTTLSWSGPLPVGGTVTVTYSVTVDNPISGDGRLHNVVITPTEPGGFLVSSCPPGSTSPDCFADTGVLAATAGRQLASTGSDLQLRLMLAALLLAAGAVALVAGRRRGGSGA